VYHELCINKGRAVISLLCESLKQKENSKPAIKMTDETIEDRQRHVIDNLHDEDFKMIEHCEPMKVFDLLTQEEKAPFLESIAKLVRTAIVARKVKVQRIEDIYNLTMVSSILFIDSVCSCTSF
jgi:uncharacterized membrane protein